jgi:phytoene dehydrogenase-like protein
VRSEIVIVGAGLAGLTAAAELHRRGSEVLVLEAGDGVGGRVRTDAVDGFLLDRGFQVLLTAYPTAAQVLDMGALDIQPFEPGALVRVDGDFCRIGDPFRRPLDAWSTVTGRVGTAGDLVRLLLLRQRVRRGEPEQSFDGLDETIAYRLRKLHFSPRITRAFLRPLVAGITLDPELSSSTHVFDFVLRMLSSGKAGVPAEGMGAIAAQLAGRLPEGSIRLQTRVDKVAGNGVVVDGEMVEAEHVIVATNATAAASLVPELTDPGWLGVTTLWFSGETPPIEAPVVVLDGEAEPAMNAAVLSNVAPSYAPVGRTLVAVSLPATGGPDLEGVVRRRLREWWWEEPVDEWDLLRVDEIERAQPRQLPGFAYDAPVRVGDVIVAGDHRRMASIEGAIRSGVDAAAELI